MTAIDGSASLAEAVRATPSGGQLELPPGRYTGPVKIDRGLVLRGSGDLSRIALGPGERGSVLHITTREPVVLDSLLIEGGHARRGGGIEISGGEVRIFNVQVRDCRAFETGGGLFVAAGEVDAERVRFFDVDAERGGAIAVRGSGRLRLRDGEIRRAEAGRGGALAFEGSGRVRFEGVTAGRCRARRPGGGQVVWMTGRDGGTLGFERVRVEGTPLAPLVVNDPEWPVEFAVSQSDLPRMVQGVPGLVVEGETRWR